MTIADEIREACAWVAERGEHVRIDAVQIGEYAVALPLAEFSPSPEAIAAPAGAARELAQEHEVEAARWLTLDAINFGSGWFPTLRKHEQPTGYRTIAAGIARQFDGPGPWSASALMEIDSAELARLFRQDLDHPLMGLFAESLRDLGRHIEADYDGAFANLVADVDGSAVKLVATLSGWRCFADCSTYAGREIPFYKRAQIAAADLHRSGLVSFGDLDQLTLFADNLVPHVLRLDGVLWFEPELVGRIEAGELIEHGSPEEVEIRACALTAVEQIVAARNAHDVAADANRAARGGQSLGTPHTPPLTAAALDEYLWNLGQSPRYKSVPRHRSRCTAY